MGYELRKIAHDNTLDDYHVAIAHKDTLHKEQGPIKNYRYKEIYIPLDYSHGPI